MNINDPFGRVQSRQQKEYESLRDSLKELGVNTPEAARAILERIQRRGKTGLAIIVSATLLLALLFAKLFGFFLACGALAAFWVIKTTLRSREYVQRYMQEEIEEQNENLGTGTL